MLMKLKTKDSIIKYYKNKLVEQLERLTDENIKNLISADRKHRVYMNDERIRWEASKLSEMKDMKEKYAAEIKRLKENYEKEIIIKNNEVKTELNKLERAQRRQDELNIQLENEIQRVKIISAEGQVIEAALMKHNKHMDLDRAKMGLLIGELSNLSVKLESGKKVDPPVVHTSEKAVK